MKKRYYLIFLILFLNGCSPVTKNESKKISKVVLVTKERQYTAGDAIVLIFNIDGVKNLKLVLKNAFGSSVIIGKRIGNNIKYKIPYNYATKVGSCYWNLIWNKKELVAGKINIQPNSTKTTIIETYIGPPSIIAGVTDYTMLVTIPTDTYDNPLEDGTSVAVKHQFENTITETNVRLKNGIAWENIYSTRKSGRILVSASCNRINSKELTTLVFPAKATDFKIEIARVHQFADGNQVINLITSKITDEYGNVVSDGTLVNFIIEDTKGAKLKAIGTILNGVATAKMLHPSEKETWKVTAYITGTAKSDEMVVNFETAVEDFPVKHSYDHRTITVGPIKSFMQQLIPDGIHMSCAIYNEKNQLIETKETTSRKGMSSFYLDPDFYKKGSYQIKINSMGLLKAYYINLNE